MYNEINKVLVCLKKSNIILYPTDTVWGIGCDATDEVAVSKIYKLKRREETKSLIVLVNSVEMLSEYVENISKKVIEVLASASKPTTIIYKHSKGLAKNTIAIDGTIAIRIVQDDFCKQLIQEFGKPIVSTSANISGEPTPKFFSEISNIIVDNVDYIVNLQQEKIATSTSTILKISKNGTIKIIRA